MPNDLITIVRENITHGPSDIQLLVTAPEIDRVPQSIGQKYMFDQEDTLIIKNAAILTLAGILPPQDIPAHLSDVLNLSNAQSREIAEELDMKLFARVRVSLDSLYSNIELKKPELILPPPPPPPPAARRAIPTHTIVSTPNNQSVRPVDINTGIQTTIKTITPLPKPTLQTNTDTQIKKTPFNTPALTLPTTPPATSDNMGTKGSSINTDLSDDILSAKLSKPINNPSSNEKAIGKGLKARTYHIDPYREPVE